MAVDLLTKGTTIVVAGGVAFDLWVSFWLVDQPDTTVTKTITLIIVSILLFGLLLMAWGWLQETESA